MIFKQMAIKNFGIFFDFKTVKLYKNSKHINRNITKTYKR